MKTLLARAWHAYWDANMRLAAPLADRMTDALGALPAAAYDETRTTLVRTYRGRGWQRALERDITRLAALG